MVLWGWFAFLALLQLLWQLSIQISQLILLEKDLWGPLGPTSCSKWLILKLSQVSQGTELSGVENFQGWRFSQALQLTCSNPWSLNLLFYLLNQSGSCCNLRLSSCSSIACLWGECLHPYSPLGTRRLPQEPFLPEAEGAQFLQLFLMHHMLRHPFDVSLLFIRISSVSKGSKMSMQLEMQLLTMMTKRE